MRWLIVGMAVIALAAFSSYVEWGDWWDAISGLTVGAVGTMWATS